jgi:hypothetical protein
MTMRGIMSALALENNSGIVVNWESMATREREDLETRCVKSLLVVYLLSVSFHL